MSKVPICLSILHNPSDCDGHKLALQHTLHTLKARAPCRRSLPHTCLPGSSTSAATRRRPSCPPHPLLPHASARVRARAGKRRASCGPGIPVPSTHSRRHTQAHAQRKHARTHAGTHARTDPPAHSRALGLLPDPVTVSGEEGRGGRSKPWGGPVGFRPRKRGALNNA